MPYVLALAERAISFSSASASARRALPVESIVRCTLLKQYFGVGYRTLEFMLEDSQSFRAFARLPDEPTKRSALQKNIRLIDDATWEEINTYIVKNMADFNIENMDKARMDSTVIKSNIHEPSDSSLLWDCIRYLNRKVYEAKRIGADIRSFKNNNKNAKSAYFKAFNEKKENKIRHYETLLKHLNYTVHYVNKCLIQAQRLSQLKPKLVTWIDDIKLKLRLSERVAHQTRRRVFEDNPVEAGEKVVSIFEFHTNVIVKGHRHTEYGHKINIVSGEQGFILACEIEQGNPCDSDIFLPMISILRAKPS